VTKLTEYDMLFDAIASTRTHELVIAGDGLHERGGNSRVKLKLQLRRVKDKMVMASYAIGPDEPIRAAAVNFRSKIPKGFFKEPS
jgi:hypothetical protein